eukprot:CAMPEP_0171238200 /NCGR_PEP_ID=MMETSP0790-20130122/43352_1 /TAXON_ID=2925 /ORGANISM="Alexandrium catenella, Strain OF101" /LENGTH=854 /DNA_ID=CAMNT_0011704561 /DNA_START=43 /DNA_END=2607 /DNA_ORIENTATION=-
MAPKDLEKGRKLRQAAEEALSVGDFDAALDKAKEAIDLLEDGGEEEVSAMCALASAYLVTGKPKLAIEKAKAALSMGETVGAGSKTAAMLNMVKVYMGYKVVPAAILSPEAALLSLRGFVGPAAGAVTEAVKVVPGIDTDMSPSVDTSILAEAMDDATKVAEDALALFKEAGDKKGEAFALYLSTYIKSEKRLLRDALPALDEVQKLFKDAGASKEEELVIKDILSYHLGKADSEAAGKIKSEVTAGDKKAGAAKLIRVVADTYFTMKELDQAQKLVQEAVAMFREVKDKDGEVGGLRAVVNCHLAKGELDDALGVMDQVVGKVDNKFKAGSMYMVASLQLSKDDGLSEAVAALGKVRSFFKDAGDSAGEAQSLMATAELQMANGDVDAAAASAVEASSAASDASMKAKTLLTVANTCSAKGDIDGAMKAATEAQAKAKEAGDKALEVNSLRSMAEVKLAKGDASGAIETATDMYTMASESSNTLGEANAKFILATAVLSTDPGSQEGLRMGKEALALFDTAGDVFGQASTLYMLANGFFARCDLEEGLKCAREALAIFRSTKDAENEEVLKAMIEDARNMTAEYRKQAPKRPMQLPADPPPATGAAACPYTESRVPKDVLEPAVAARKYWGIPKMVQNDPTVDAIERAPSHAIIFGQNLQDNIATQICVEFGDLVATMAKGDVAKIPIVVMTQGVNGRMTGEHIPHHITGVSSVTIWGMVRTVRQEIPQVHCLLLDFSGAQTTAQIPRNLRMPPMVAESAYYHGARWEPQLAQVPSLFRRELKRDNLTGGGGGSNMGDPKKAAKFMRRSFNWTGPTHKLDYAWYRQEWRAVGAAMGDAGPMPPQQPCRAMRTV